jgi:hypothetical protein
MSDPTPAPLPASPPNGAPPNSAQPMMIEFPQDLEATYTNFALITHSPSEVLIDFARLLPNMKPRVLNRMVLTPVNAKLLWRALADNLSKYEAQFGEIVLPTSLAEHLFRPPKSE